MDPQEILKFCVERGLLLDPEVLNLFTEAGDTESVKMIIEKLKTHTQKRMITKNLFEQNKEHMSEFFLTLPKENQKNLERMKIKLGLKIEISKEISSQKVNIIAKNQQDFDEDVKITSKTINFQKKIIVEDFVKSFRNRFYELKCILQEHSELDNPISINKLSRGGQKVSVIGMVFSKKITKNRNFLFEVEDLTGKVKILINQNRPEIYKKAEDIALDSVVGFNGFGDREIFFANDVIFPD